MEDKICFSSRLPIQHSLRQRVRSRFVLVGPSTPPHPYLAHKVSFTEFYEMVTGGNQPPPGLGGVGGVPAAGGGGGGGGTALATTAPLGQNVVQQRNKKKQVGNWV